MSRLATLRQYQYSPAAGGLFSGLIKGVGKFVGAGIKALTGSKAAKVVATAAKSPVGQAAIYTGAGMAASALMTPGSGKSSGASGTFGVRRRGRGITARELRGYRKVSRLLHKEGMVSKIARGRKH